MLNISGETRLKPDAVMKLAQKFFIEDNGLSRVDASDTCATFEGGGGAVTVTLTKSKDSETTTVDVVTREWEYQVKKFLELLKTR